MGNEGTVEREKVEQDFKEHSDPDDQQKKKRDTAEKKGEDEKDFKDHSDPDDQQKNKKDTVEREEDVKDFKEDRDPDDQQMKKKKGTVEREKDEQDFKEHTDPDDQQKKKKGTGEKGKDEKDFKEDSDPDDQQKMGTFEKEKDDKDFKKKSMLGAMTFTEGQIKAIVQHASEVAGEKTAKACKSEYENQLVKLREEKIAIEKYWTDRVKDMEKELKKRKSARQQEYTAGGEGEEAGG